MLGMQIFTIAKCDKQELEEFFFLRNTGIEEGSFDDVENVRLKELITKLSPITQKIIWLRFWQNFRNEEVADILGCREEDIKHLLEEALAQLRYELVIKKNQIH